MFKKLVSNIPFNPSLIDQVPEYQLQLTRQLKLRLIGLCILGLALVVQLFITLFPAQPTLTSSPNDLINGGFISKQQLVKDCDENLQGYKNILSFYAINCSSLNDASNVTIRSTSYNKQLYSLNRINYGQTELAQTIGSSKYFIRPLWSGNALSSVNLQALSGSNPKVGNYFILQNSGDVVFIGQPAIYKPCPTSNCPDLSITARDSQFNDVNNKVAKPADTVIYTLSANNTSDRTINNFVVSTNFNSALTYSSVNNLYGGSIINGTASWPSLNIPPKHTVTESISFNVNNSTTKTPLSSSDSNYYNMKMIVGYGNAVTIKVPWVFSKYFELKINNSLWSLPRYLSLVVSSLLVLFVMYFLCRNRLLNKELSMVKKNYLNGGKN